MDENEAASRGINCLLTILKIVSGTLNHKMRNEFEDRLL